MRVFDFICQIIFVFCMLYFAFGYLLPTISNLENNPDYLKPHELVIHRGTIANITVYSSFLNHQTVIYFKDGSVYTLSGTPAGLIIGKDYEVWKYEHDSEIQIRAIS